MKQYKKYIVPVVAVIAAVWVICISFSVYYKVSQNKKIREGQTDFAIVTQQPIPQSTAGSTPKTTEKSDLSDLSGTSSYFIFSDVPMDSTTANGIDDIFGAGNNEAQGGNTQQTTDGFKMPSNKDEVVEAYVAAVNKLKGTDSFTLVKENEPTITVDEVTGGSLIKNAVDSSIKSNTEKIVSPATYVFTGGQSPDGETPNSIIAPENKNAVLSSDNVLDAKATRIDNEKYKITISLGQQKQTLNKGAAGYSDIMDVIKVEDFNMPNSLEISTLDITYSNSTIEAEIDKDGKILSMKHNLNVKEAVGTGKLAMISATLKMHGTYYTNYKITY